MYKLILTYEKIYSFFCFYFIFLEDLMKKKLLRKPKIKLANCENEISLKKNFLGLL